ncbi:MAG: hypothetical protein DRI70_07600, partial [Bacteroidetes bacterium]
MKTFFGFLMKNVFPAINIVLALVIVTLTTIAANTWIVPNYPDNGNGDLIAHVPKTLAPLVLNRKVNHAKAINTVVQGNLFRKDRKEFSPPVQVRQMAHEPASPTLPPPDLKLKGVLILGDKKIAIIEGDYPIREGDQAVKKKPLNRKGYLLGSRIGSFELT